MIEESRLAQMPHRTLLKLSKELVRKHGADERTFPAGTIVQLERSHPFIMVSVVGYPAFGVVREELEEIPACEAVAA